MRIKTGIVKGIRTDCVTKEQRTAEFGYEIFQHEDGKKVFQLIGGPTGYESFYIDDHMINALKDPKRSGWVACMGTDGVYDRLEISSAEMRKALGIEETPQ